jgi:hypothetical protein
VDGKLITRVDPSTLTLEHQIVAREVKLPVHTTLNSNLLGIARPYYGSILHDGDWMEVKVTAISTIFGHKLLWIS